MDGWFDSPIESFKQTYRDAVASWQEAMTALDASYSEFQGNYGFAQDDSELSQKWGDLDGKVSVLQETIQGVSDAIESIKHFFSESIGMSGGTAAMHGMGVLPVIPWALVALITAGVAGVWAVINQLRSFNVDVANKKIAAQNIINSQNGDPIIPYLDLGGPGGPSSGGIFSGLPDTAKWIAIGVIGFMVLQTFDKHAGRA